MALPLTLPLTVKERMEALGWVFDCDINDGGDLAAAAMKLDRISPTVSRVTHYHTDQQFKTDVAACMAACQAEEGWS